jgi:hypothetical protein
MVGENHEQSSTNYNEIQFHIKITISNPKQELESLEDQQQYLS